MKKPIKKTPLSFGGVDFYEILIEDDTMGDNCACDLCLYSDYPSFNLDLMASCMDIHGCTTYSNRYFILEPIQTNK